MHGMEQCRATLGSEQHSGFDDAAIRDTLYHYYFDVEQSLNWLFGK